MSASAQTYPNVRADPGLRPRGRNPAFVRTLPVPADALLRLCGLALSARTLGCVHAKASVIPR
jgi:hypothetical protein